MTTWAELGKDLAHEVIDVLSNDREFYERSRREVVNELRLISVEKFPAGNLDYRAFPHHSHDSELCEALGDRIQFMVKSHFQSQHNVRIDNEKTMPETLLSRLLSLVDWYEVGRFYLQQAREEYKHS